MTPPCWKGGEVFCCLSREVVLGVCCCCWGLERVKGRGGGWCCLLPRVREAWRGTGWTRPWLWAFGEDFVDEVEEARGRTLERGTRAGPGPAVKEALGEGW